MTSEEMILLQFFLEKQFFVHFQKWEYFLWFNISFSLTISEFYFYIEEEIALFPVILRKQESAHLNVYQEY
jgi:hypothetical protein